jgi:hypothetical protein
MAPFDEVTIDLATLERSPPAGVSLPAARHLPWLFSATVDLATFGGSAVVSLLLLAVGYYAGWLDRDSPEWTWVGAVLLVDVAHVYATAFRVYFSPAELQRRAALYVLTPVVAFAAGVVLYGQSEIWFWRALAYLAVFHFVRQQFGWVAMYRAKASERDRLGAWIDSAAIYAATLYPLLYWHAHLPRRFWWFLNDDFVSLPANIAAFAAPLYVLALAAYFARSLFRGLKLSIWNPGKDLVVLTTAVCWYAGIVATNSDYAFTVTNVIIHGVPYMVLIYWYNVRESGAGSQPIPQSQRRLFRGVVFLATLWVLAYLEELAWDRGYWHERTWLFGDAWDLGRVRPWLAPALAVPQITHYVLDGFIWRRRSNPDLT